MTLSVVVTRRIGHNLSLGANNETHVLVERAVKRRTKKGGRVSALPQDFLILGQLQLIGESLTVAAAEMLKRITPDRSVKKYLVPVWFHVSGLALM